MKGYDNCEEELKEEDRRGLPAKGKEAEALLSHENFNLMVGAFAILMLGLGLFNQFAINDVNKKLEVVQAAKFAAPSTAAPSAKAEVGSSQANPASSNTNNQQASLASSEQLWTEIAPKGKPAVYGDELGVSYDNPEAGIPILYQFDDYYGKKPIQLSGEKQQRYIAITTAISCEYCCGANAITTSSGAAACGCAHSAAMRGLAKYLLDKHDDMSNEQILEELGKWKVLYFPSDSVKKAAALKANNLPTDYISLSSNKYRSIEKQAAKSSSSGGALPSQVGGC